MLMRMALCLWALLCLAAREGFARSTFADTAAPAPVSRRTLSRIESRLKRLNQSILQNTTTYLRGVSGEEQALRNRLASADGAVSGLFAGASASYQGLEQRIRTDTGGQAFRGTYIPTLDTVRGALLFLQQHPEMTNAPASNVQADLLQLQTLQARMQDADPGEGLYALSATKW